LWEKGGWTFASRKVIPLCESEIESPDAVVIVPYLQDKLLIIKEFRLPLGDYEYSFPAGLVDKGESVIDAAKRELFEETGLVVTKIIKESPPVYSSAGLTDESCCYVYVECEGTPSTQHQESTEKIETLLLGAKECEQLLYRTGSFKNAKVSAKCWPIVEAWTTGKKQ